MTTDVVEQLNKLILAFNALQADYWRLKAEYLIDQDLLGSLILSFEDIETLQRAWQEVSSATHADRVVRLAAMPDDRLLEKGKAAQAARMAYWADTIERVCQLRKGV